MARRGKSSLLEDVFEVVAMLPWWGGVIAALTSYLLLHSLASRSGVSVSHVFAAGLAGVFQIIIPLICLGAAAVSARKASHRKSLAQNITASNSASSLDGMTWREFELLVGEAFRQKGYKVQELGGAGPDGGVDLALTKGSEKFFVQCKQWKAFKVGVDVVRQLYGVMAARGAAGGFVVTSGTFTQDAEEFARGRNVNLIDGAQLFTMLQSAKARLSEVAPTKTTDSASPPCPVCGSAMVRREAKRGANAGSSFWGCSTYPKCRGTAKV